MGGVDSSESNPLEYLTSELADNHYQNGGGAPVYVDRTFFMTKGAGLAIDFSGAAILKQLSGLTVGQTVTLNSGTYARPSGGIEPDEVAVDFYKVIGTLSNEAYVYGDSSGVIRGTIEALGNGRYNVDLDLRVYDEQFGFENNNQGGFFEFLRSVGGWWAGDGDPYEIRFRGDGSGRIVKGEFTLEELKAQLSPKPIIAHCFPSGTAVLTVHGHTAIEALGLGDLVLAFDPMANLGRCALVPKRVVRLFQNETEEWLRLTWREGDETRELTVTPGHRFLDANGRFRRIDEIITDAQPAVVLEDGSLTLISAERIIWSEETRHLFEEVEAVAMAAGDGLSHREGGTWRSYNFEVEDLHTYIAGGVRVHNDSQTTIDLAGNLGRTFGTQLANVLLEGESQFTKVLGGTVLGTITENLAEVITSTGYHMFDAHKYSFAQSFKDAVGNQVGDIGTEFMANLSSTMTSLLIAEFGEELGLDGFGAQLFSVTGSAYAGSVLEQLAKNKYDWGHVNWDAAWSSVPGAVGTFFGSSLAHKILPAETLEGSIGGSLGSIVGTSWAIGQVGGVAGMQAFGLIGNFLIPGVGAFIGTLLGTFLGDLFGRKPDPGADFLMFAEQQGENIIPGVLDYYLYATAKDGFPNDYTKALGDAVIDITKNYMSNIGAFDMSNANVTGFKLPSQYVNNDPNQLGANPLVRVLQKMQVDVANDGSYVFYVNGQKVASAEAMVDGAVADFLRDSQPIGGDIFLKRAVVNSTGDNAFTIAAAMATAAEYEKYLDNKEVVNALIASSPDSAFAGAWVYTLAGAEQLKLARVSQVDFNGGLGGFLASLTDAGMGLDLSKTLIQRGANGTILVKVAVEDAESIPSYINLFANGASVTKATDGSAVVQFTFGSNMAAVGYANLTTSTAIAGTTRYDVTGESRGRDLWIAPDNKSYNFVDIGVDTISVGATEIESSDDILIAASGNDSIQAGTGWDWISGGAGNDTLHGGNQDDTIFGGAGNDLIYGGRQMDYLEGGAGADIIYGTAQGDSGQQLDPLYHATDYAAAGYKGSSAAVNINLTSGAANGGDATGDDLNYIINLVGSDYNDTLVGSGISNWLEGGAGADVLHGGNDTLVPPGETAVPPDYASYFRASAGITASLANRTVNTGDAAGDTYQNIEGLQGSNFNDILIGDANNNFLMGMSGDDILVAGTGRDSIRGGFGFDILSYRSTGSAVRIDLASWASSSAVVADDVRNSQDIEAYEGTNYDDSLYGADRGDVLIGRTGNDNINGRQGSDALWGDSGNDTIYGAEGDDSLSGGDGNDYLLGGAGADAMEGGSGVDRVQYNQATAGVVADLVNSAVNTGEAKGDTYKTVENLYGTNFNDNLRGDINSNVLYGADGNDRLYGREGNDIFLGDEGADSVYGGSGVDRAQYSSAVAGVRVDLADDSLNTGEAAGDILDSIENLLGSQFNDNLRGDSLDNALYGEDGDDYLYARDGNDRLYGDVGNDYLSAGNGSDHVDAGDGNDTIVGSWGNDTIYGGGGWDTFDFSTSTASVSIDFTTQVHTGFATGNLIYQVEHITAGSGNDTLRGASGANRIDAGAGNDLLIATLGADTLIGGAGTDRVSYEKFTAGVVADLANEATNSGGAAGDIYEAIENLTGTAYDDTLRGGDTGNNLQGGAGDDHLDGRAGNDALGGGDGNDSLVGGAGADTMIGGDGDDAYWIDSYDDTIVETADGGTDIIYTAFSIGLGDDAWANVEKAALLGTADAALNGTAAHNTLIGNAGDNILKGYDGNDSLSGGAGADTMIGGDGDDSYWIDNAGDILTEIATGGVDRILSTISLDLTGRNGAYANVENVVLQGDDDLAAYGSADSNVFIGNTGDNILAGRAGNDSLTGAAGADTFTFNKGYDQDVILDFQDNLDTIRMLSFGVANFTQAQAYATQSGANVDFDFGAGDILTVRNTTINALADDMVFA